MGSITESELMTKLIHRPNAQIPWLQYQIGKYVERKAVYPTYVVSGTREQEDEDGNIAMRPVYTINGYETSKDNVRVFHVSGFGETKKAAEAMAGFSAILIEVQP